MLSELYFTLYGLHSLDGLGDRHHSLEGQSLVLAIRIIMIRNGVGHG